MWLVLCLLGLAYGEEPKTDVEATVRPPVPARRAVWLGAAGTMWIGKDPYRHVRQLGPDGELGVSFTRSGGLGASVRVLAASPYKYVEVREFVGGATTVMSAERRVVAWGLMGGRAERRGPGGPFGRSLRLGFELNVGPAWLRDERWEAVSDEVTSVLRLQASQNVARPVFAAGTDVTVPVAGDMAVRVGFLAQRVPDMGQGDGLTALSLTLSTVLERRAPDPWVWQPRDTSSVLATRRTWVSASAGFTLMRDIDWRTNPALTVAMGRVWGSQFGVVARVGLASASQWSKQRFPFYVVQHDGGFSSMGVRYEVRVQGVVLGVDVGAGLLLSSVDIEDIDRRAVGTASMVSPMLVGGVNASVPIHVRWSLVAGLEPTRVYGARYPRRGTSLRSRADDVTRVRALVGLERPFGPNGAGAPAKPAQRRCSSSNRTSGLSDACERL